jgi:2-iminobutanoate/2-iminopropanoate deaminase
MKVKRNPNQVHPPLASYSHQIEISGNQRWLMLSGQVGIDKDGELLPDPIDQFKQALSNIELNLKAADMQINDLVKLMMYFTVKIDPNLRRKVLSSWLKDHQPAMTLL